MSVLIVALAAALLGCGTTPPASETAPPSGQAGAPTGPGGGGRQEQLAQLGITGRPSETDPAGLLVTGFLPSSDPWPLQTLGVEVGDAIIMCNDQQQQIGTRLTAAIDGLQARGEPITLVVLRNNDRVTLQRDEKLPGAKTAEETE